MNSSFQFDHNRLFDNLENALKNDLASIQVEANGGRSILFVYPCDDDDEYIAEGKRRLSPDQYCFIDIRETFAEYVSEIGTLEKRCIEVKILQRGHSLPT